MVTDSRADEHTESPGASPTVWAIFFSSLAVSIALVLEGSVRLEPDWTRWWAAILGLEISAYTLTMFLPPFTRVNLLHALCRVGVGMLMRLFVVALCALLLVVGGEAHLGAGLKRFWAAHWPSAIGQIVCVAIAVYCFRVIATRRAAMPRQPATAVPAAPTVTRSPDELLQELMSDGASFESAEASPTAVAEPGFAQPRPAPPPIEEPEVEEPGAPTGITPALEPLAPPASVQAPLGQDAEDVADEFRTVPESLAPPPMIHTPETEVGAEAPPQVAAEAALDEVRDEPSYDAAPPFPTVPLQRPTTPWMAEPPPPEAPPEPAASVEPPPAVTYPGPMPLPTVREPITEETEREEMPPEPEVPSVPAAEETAREELMEPAAPLPTQDFAPAVTPIDDTIAEEVEASEEPAEVMPPSPVAEVETEEAPHEPPAVDEESATPATTAGPAAEPTEPRVPVTDPSTSGALRLPAEVVLSALPADLLDRPTEEVAEKVPDGMFSFEWETIAPQLERGQVRVTGQALLGQIPREMLAISAGDFLSSLPTDGIELPLAEIVTQLPADFFAAPADQVALEPFADEPPIFEEGTPRPAPQPASAPPQVSQPAPPAPAPVSEAEPETPAVQEPQPPPEPEPVTESALPADTGSWQPPVIEEQEPTDTEEDATEPPAEPAVRPFEGPPAAAFEPDASGAPEEVPPEAVPELVHRPSPRNEKHVISSAIAALQKRQEAERQEEAEEKAPEPTEAGLPADEPAISSEAAVPEEAPAAEVAADDQALPAIAEEPAPVEPDPTLAKPVAEPSGAQIEEGAIPPPTPLSPAEEPAAAPAASSPLDPQLDSDLRNALKIVACQGVGLISANGVSVVVAHTAPDTTSEAAASFAELVKTTRHIAAKTGAGTFRSALLIGRHATTFVGSPENPQAPHLVVATDSASPGQTTVAARKAISLLESVETTGEPGTDEPSGMLPPTLPSEDERLRRIGTVVSQKVDAFRSEDGLGVVALNLETEANPGTAAAAQAVWRAAQAAQQSGVERLLVMGSSRMLGLAMAEEAEALIVAGFAPGMNPGMVATETAKLVRTCNDLAQREGMPTDVG